MASGERDEVTGVPTHTHAHTNTRQRPRNARTIDALTLCLMPFAEHLLKKPLTVVDQFHSHLEPMKFIRRDILGDQVISSPRLDKLVNGCSVRFS